MKKVDRIRALENQLEHEKKRVAELITMNKGLAEAQKAMDAIIYAFAERYGEARYEDDGVTLIGWHMDIKRPDVENVSQDQIRVHPVGENWNIGVLAAEKKTALDIKNSKEGLPS